MITKQTIRELTNGRNFIGQIFLEGITDEAVKEITEKEGYSVDMELEIELKIGGISIDATKYFKFFSEQYEEHVKNAARNLVDENACGPLNDMIYELDLLKNKIEALNDSIDWDTILLKPKK